MRVQSIDLQGHEVLVPVAVDFSHALAGCIHDVIHGEGVDPELYAQTLQELRHRRLDARPARVVVGRDDHLAVVQAWTAAAQRRSHGSGWIAVALAPTEPELRLRLVDNLELLLVVLDDADLHALPIVQIPHAPDQCAQRLANGPEEQPLPQRGEHLRGDDGVVAAPAGEALAHPAQGLVEFLPFQQKPKLLAEQLAQRVVPEAVMIGPTSIQGVNALGTGVDRDHVDEVVHPGVEILRRFPKAPYCVNLAEVQDVLVAATRGKLAPELKLLEHRLFRIPLRICGGVRKGGLPRRGDGFRRLLRQGHRGTLDNVGSAAAEETAGPLERVAGVGGGLRPRKEGFHAPDLPTRSDLLSKAFNLRHIHRVTRISLLSCRWGPQKARTEGHHAAILIAQDHHGILRHTQGGPQTVLDRLRWVHLRDADPLALPLRPENRDDTGACGPC
mmetsp:Transcript_106373/g.295966  ORF Transcript_106373/g.295966 Transcript_106373/m.295966 type:complete len:444 (-) Transcript_106373:301-1632(-)